MRLSLFILLFLCVGGAAADGVMETEQPFDAAVAAYESKNFATSITLLEQLRETDPDCAHCAHLLGKAYGRLAEESSWHSAIGLAKKSRKALENAVALDPLDANALADLIKFYRAAPSFLGGDEDKANALEHELKRLLGEQTS